LHCLQSFLLIIDFLKGTREPDMTFKAENAHTS
jgi:hypothetical protein